MKNLGKTIDQLIQMEPGLEGKLLQIKNKWKRFPERALAYWKELLNYLNTVPSILSLIGFALATASGAGGSPLSH